MSDNLTNDEIRKSLLEYNFKCGPVTDTTREVHIKKLLELKIRGDKTKEKIENISDAELRLQLTSLGQSVGPITKTSRPAYVKKLARLKIAETDMKLKEKFNVENKNYLLGDEPMEID